MYPSQIEFLRHIPDECRYLQRESESNSFNSFIKDERLIRAVCRSLEIIGEACSKIQPEVRAAYPFIEWRLMSDMRNRIIHFYFGVDYDVVWDTVVTDIPLLEQSITEILQQSEDLN